MRAIAHRLAGRCRGSVAEALRRARGRTSALWIASGQRTGHEPAPQEAILVVEAEPGADASIRRLEEVTAAWRLAREQHK